MVISLEREQILRRVRKHREHEKLAEDYRRLNQTDFPPELDIGPFEVEFQDLLKRIRQNKVSPDVFFVSTLLLLAFCLFFFALLHSHLWT